MVAIGVDAHKRIHVAVALDDMGQLLGQWRGPNTVAGWQELADWAQTFPEPQSWGIEGAWNYGRGLAQALVAAEAVVYDINPRWTAQRRRGARKPGKNDRLDAHAVAKLVQEDAPTLPRVCAEDTSTLLNLLVVEREELVSAMTGLRNQLHQLLLQVNPMYATQLPALTTKAGLQALEDYTTASPNPRDQHRVAAIQRMAKRLKLAWEQARTLEHQIRTLVDTTYGPLTQLCGVDQLTAGALAGILGPGQRFRHEAQVAALAGVAPLEASSAGHVRHRLNRGGNRRLNAVVHRIAISQLRWSEQAQAYVARRQAEGKTRREAIRALKRFVVRAIWRQWQACLANPTAGTPA